MMESFESFSKHTQEYTLKKVAFASHEVFIYKKRWVLTPFTLSWPLKVPLPQQEWAMSLKWLLSQNGKNSHHMHACPRRPELSHPSSLSPELHKLFRPWPFVAEQSPLPSLRTSLSALEMVSCKRKEGIK